MATSASLDKVRLGHQRWSYDPTWYVDMYPYGCTLYTLVLNFDIFIEL